MIWQDGTWENSVSWFNSIREQVSLGDKAGAKNTSF